MPAPSVTSGDRVKVSVVVPVYNPGRYIDDCIASMLRQSLPLDEYEAIFVDDGSTDGTGERLDALAAEHPHITAIHIPNSGWPGRPRNVGTDVAKGKYVYFVDNDDWLNDEALERLYDYAERNGSDVVVGKEVGHGKGVPRHLFRRNVDDAKLLETPLLDILTPHKLFRKAFLDEHGIRFPEGRRRLEDHVFVMKAFFAARRISVLADYPCYHWIRREDASNATDHYADPRGYYENVREILDVVDANTEPGPIRDRYYAHWYRSKGLHRMRGPGWSEALNPHATRVYTEVRRLALERFGPGVARALPMKFRVLSRSVVEDRRDLVRAQAALERGLKAEPAITALDWVDGRLRLRLTATLCYRDGTAVSVERRDDRLYWAPPAPLGEDHAILDEDLDVTDELPRTSVAVVLRHRASFTEYDAVGTVEEAPDHAGERELTISPQVTVEIDPATFAVGAALEAGVWDIFVHVTSCGWGAVHRLVCSPEVLGEVEPSPLGDSRLTVVPYITEPGNLSLRVGRARPPSARSAPPATSPVATAEPARQLVEPAVPPERHSVGAASTTDLVAAARRLLDPAWADGPNSEARAAFAALRRMALDHGAQLPAGMPLALRVLTRAALADRMDMARAHVRLMRGLRAEVRRDGDGRAGEEEVAIALSYADGAPVRLRRSGPTVYWEVPPAVTHAGLTDTDVDVTDELTAATVAVGGPGAAHRVAATVDDGELVVLRAVPSRDEDASTPRTIVVEIFGWAVRARVRHDADAGGASPPGGASSVLVERAIARALRVARRAARSLNLR